MGGLSFLDALQWAGSLLVIAGYAAFSVRHDRFWGSTWTLLACSVWIFWASLQGFWGVIFMNAVIAGLTFWGIIKALKEN